MRRIIFGTCLLLLFAACQSESANTASQNQWPVNLDELVVLHCRSIELKDARFELANEIRFAEDSLLRADTLVKVELTKTLEEALIRKKSLAEESHNLADTIRVKMDRVMKELNPDEKRIFNDSLIAKSKRAGCQE
jgi:hypothetical protein